MKCMALAVPMQGVYICVCVCVCVCVCGAGAWLNSVQQHQSYRGSASKAQVRPVRV